MSGRKGIFKVPANHLSDEPVLIHIRNIRAVHISTIPKHRDPVTDFKQLLQPVRYINHRDSILLKLSHNLKQHINFFLGQTVRRFIHNNDFCMIGYCFCDVYHLLLCNA